MGHTGVRACVQTHCEKKGGLRPHTIPQTDGTNAGARPAGGIAAIFLLHPFCRRGIIISSKKISKSISVISFFYSQFKVRNIPAYNPFLLFNKQELMTAMVSTPAYERS